MITKHHKTERAKKIAFWEPHITAWNNSGLGATAYCRQHKLSLHKFKYWQYQIAKIKVRKQENIEPEITKQSEFVEIIKSSAPSHTTHNTSRYEIITQYGFTISLHGDLSQHYLFSVFHALKDLS